MTYSISCVIPVYNGEPYLYDAIESILKQTFSPTEIIIVDDGSTDNTPGVVRAFGGAVRYQFQSRRGPSAARNRGIDSSHGQYIAFLDADDLFVKEKLKMQVACLRQKPGLEMVAGYTENFLSPDFPGDAGGHEFFRREPWPRGIMTWLVKKTVFDQVGIFDESMRVSQDIDWHMRAEVAGVSMETLPNVLSRRRIHVGNSTRFANSECRAAVLQSLRKHVIEPRRSRSTNKKNDN